jgi:hypothetical protein
MSPCKLPLIGEIKPHYNFLIYILVLALSYVGYVKLENKPWVNKHNLLLIDLIFYIEIASYLKSYICFRRKPNIRYDTFINLIINMIIVVLIIYLDNYNDKYNFIENINLIIKKISSKDNIPYTIAKIIKYILLFFIINNFLHVINKNYPKHLFDQSNLAKTDLILLTIIIIYLIIRYIFIFFKEELNDNMVYNIFVNYI